MELDKVFIPIQSNLHWTLTVINFRNKRLEYYDSFKGPARNGRSFLKSLKEYMEWESRTLKLPFNWKDEKWEMTNTVAEVDVPTQTNGVDCGVFMCKYADCHSQDLPFSFVQEDINKIRYRMATEIVDNYVP